MARPIKKEESGGIVVGFAEFTDADIADLVGQAVSALDDLTDVVAPTPADDDILRFDVGAGIWQNEPLPAVTISNLDPGTARQILQTNAVGTAAEWTDNVQVSGTLDVISTALFADGTVHGAGGVGAVPSIGFIAQPGTGIYRIPDTGFGDYIAFSIRGRRLFDIQGFGNSGAVISASASPEDPGHGAEFRCINDARTKSFIFGITGSGEPVPDAGLIGSDFAMPLLFRTSNLERMRILADGKVGIGAGAPSFPFHVKVAATLDSTLNVIGAVDISSTLDVTGAAVFDTTVTVVGQSSLGRTTVTGAGAFPLHVIQTAAGGDGLWLKNTARTSSADHAIQVVRHDTEAMTFQVSFAGVVVAAALNTTGAVTVGTKLSIGDASGTSVSSGDIALGTSGELRGTVIAGDNTIALIQLLNGVVWADSQMVGLNLSQRIRTLPATLNGFELWDGAAWSVNLYASAPNVLKTDDSLVIGFQTNSLVTLRVPQGSASAPSITGPDADTGVFFPASNDMRFASGGLTFMTLQLLNGAIVSTIFRPDANNTRSLGASSFRWSDVYGVDADFSGVASFSGLPSSDPLVAGQLWVDGSGFVKRSAG